MGSIRNLVAMLGGMAGVVGIGLAVWVVNWIAPTPEITETVTPAAEPPRLLAIGGGLLCLLGALAIWRAPRVSGVALSVGALGLVQGLGYTPFTLLPIGFAVVAAGLALLAVLNPDD